MNYSIHVLLFVFSIFLNSINNAQSVSPIFHLDASTGITKNNGRVMEWRDTVRNIRAIQNINIHQAEFIPQGIANYPSLRFNGSASFMNMPSIFPVNKDYSILVVCKANGPCNNILGGTSRTLWMAGATSVKILHNGDFVNQVSSGFDPGFDPVIIIAQYNHSTQTGSLILNGIFEDSSYCPANRDSTIYLSAYQGGYHFNGDIYEIQLYDRYLNETERKKLESTFITKYNIKNPPLPDQSFTNIPSNYQFFPRDENNEAEILIDGKISHYGYDSVQLFLYREQTLIDKISKALIYDTTQLAAFEFRPVIKSELANYAIEVHIKNSTKDTLINRRDHLVAGDVYIITGQSNSIFGGNPYQNEFCRTFGKNYSGNKADTLWTIASGIGNGGGPQIGAWGMELAKRIIDEYQIPVCILNGGVGGTSIQQHQRNDNQPAVPSNIYGSLLYRAQKSKLDSAVKAIFWYQGESNNSQLYFENFKSLYEDWKLDYPNVKKQYIVQIHHGCGAGDHAAVREIQRNLPKSFPAIEVISTNGLPGHDGCHYTLAGYLALAKNIFPLVQKDFYDGIDFPDLHAPSVQKAFYSMADHSEITLLFSPENCNLVLPNDTTISGIPIYLKDYFALENQWKRVDEIRVHKDSVVLKLKTPMKAATIQYLPEVNYLDVNAIYQGPYLKNENQLGALSFYRVPIEEYIPTHSEDFSSKNQFNFYPNPVSKSLGVFLDMEIEQNIQNGELQIFSVLGKRIYHKKLSGISRGKHRLSLELPDDLPEVLIWQIQTNTFSVKGKCLVL